MGTFVFGSGTPKKILYNGVEVKKMLFNGVVVWQAINSYVITGKADRPGNKA